MSPQQIQDLIAENEQLKAERKAILRLLEIPLIKSVISAKDNSALMAVVGKFMRKLMMDSKKLKAEFEPILADIRPIIEKETKQPL